MTTETRTIDIPGIGNSTFSVNQRTIDCLGGEDAARAFITRTMSEIKRNPHIPRSLRQQYLDDAICGRIDYLVERSLASWTVRLG